MLSLPWRLAEHFFYCPLELFSVLVALSRCRIPISKCNITCLLWNKIPKLFFSLSVIPSITQLSSMHENRNPERVSVSLAQGNTLGIKVPTKRASLKGKRTLVRKQMYQTKERFFIWKCVYNMMLSLPQLFGKLSLTLSITQSSSMSECRNPERVSVSLAQGNTLGIKVPTKRASLKGKRMIVWKLFYKYCAYSPLFF